MKESTRTILGFMSVAALVMSIIALMASTGHCQSLTKADFLKPQPIKETGFLRPNGPMTFAATITCGVGQASDLVSSTGYEGNGFLRGSNGKINMAKAAPLKLIPCVLPDLFDKKLPKWARVSFRVGQFFMGGLGVYDAIENRRHNRR